MLGLLYVHFCYMMFLKLFIYVHNMFICYVSWVFHIHGKHMHKLEEQIYTNMTNIRNNYVLKKNGCIHIFLSEILCYIMLCIYIYGGHVFRIVFHTWKPFYCLLFFEYNVIMFVSYFVHKRNHVLNQFSLGNLMSQN